MLSAGGNTILFRLLTKPLFCSFPPLDARKASNGGFCSGREEVSEQHKELNKMVHVLFSRYPAKSGSPKDCYGPLRGVRLSFFANVFCKCTFKTELKNLLLTLRWLMAYSVSQKDNVPGRALVMPAAASSPAGGG